MVDNAPKIQWIARDIDESHALQLSRTFSLPLAAARVLVARDLIEAESVEKFLRPSLSHLPDPHLFAGISDATARLIDALANDECIGIFGDYDVDGVTSTTILWEFLEELGARVVATIPNRLLEGYGLNQAGVDRLQAAGAHLIVTVDCGVTAHEEIDYAASKGLDVIVVDHHTVPVNLPNACAVVNPHRLDCKAERKHLCAAGVVFNLCVALRKALREEGFFEDRAEPNLKNYLDLVAVATIADVVPLTAENRIYVQQGLALIASGRRVGVQALLKACNIEPSRVTAGTLGFHLGPRINAAGRLDDAMRAVKLLRTNDVGLAENWATELDQKNQERRDIEKRVVDQAIVEIDASQKHAEAHILVVANDGWHPGVVGIAASRLVERYGKPAIVIGTNGKGSGRSIPAFHLHDALCAVGHLLQGFGGHAHAVGLHTNMAEIETLRDALVEHAKAVLSEDDLVRHIFYDGTLKLSEANHQLADNLARFAPFGRANPEPVFRIHSVIADDLKILANNHVRGILRDDRAGISFIAFNLADRLSNLSGFVDVLATLELNEWRGNKTLQLRIRDVQLVLEDT